MKKLVFSFLLLGSMAASAQYRAQEEREPSQGFQKQKLFTGGSVNLGFSSYTTNLGIAPQFGISLTNWLDAGVNLGLNYASQRDPYSPDKIRQTTIGPGAFVRLFPIDFLFATAQYEYNFVTNKYFSGTNNIKQSYHAPALLLGLGYAGGRTRGSNTYYYFSVSVDFLGHKNSPYIDRCLSKDGSGDSRRLQHRLISGPEFGTILKSYIAQAA